MLIHQNAMKILLSLLLINLSFVSVAQSKYEWIEKSAYKIDSNHIWTVDVLGNIYISKKEVIQKFDSIGNFKFSQSQKSFGRLSSIQVVNTMKLIVFSEEQQQLCFLDNTLTPYESCINFDDENIGNATKFAVSSQPDKFWIYDQLNSRLHLVSFGQLFQNQDIENIKGVLNSIQISFMFEQNNFLYLVDCNQGIFILDIYASLVNFIKRPNIKGFQIDKEFMYILEKNTLVLIDNLSNIEKNIIAPIDGVIEFKKIGNSYYFRTAKEIKKYHLLLNK
jgi:hypothetical protein